MSNQNQQDVQCEHISDVELDKKGNTKSCEECEKTGSTWVQLRLCLTCGHVGCCDSSRNKHGSKHFKSTMHPLIKSYEPGESWERCFLDETFIK